MNGRKNIRCALLGAQEKDLFILSELQKQENIQIEFIYDNLPAAIGFEIAEIMGIKRHMRPDFLLGDLDYIVVSEPRERFEEILKKVRSSKIRLLSPDEAVETLCLRPPTKPRSPTLKISEPPSIESTLQALENLFNKKELLKLLLDIAVSTARASSGSIMLYSPDAYELYIGYAIGLSERVIKTSRQKIGEGIAGGVAKEKKAKLIRLTPQDVLYAKDRERVDIASAISVPLLWESRLLGVLNVSTAKGEHELDRGDFENLKKMAGRISRVLFESSKLEEVQAHHNEKNIRITVSKLVEKPISFQEKFFLLSEYLAEIMNIETVDIYLNTHEGDWFLLGGSNRRYPTQFEKVRSVKGALSRCFLEQRTIVLTEQNEKDTVLDGSLSSFVFHPLSLTKPIGVLLTEFTQRDKLEEFLLVKESIALKISEFISSELRARKLAHELKVMNRVSESAPTLLNASSTSDICDILGRTLTSIFECSSVSVRLKSPRLDSRYVVAFYHAEPTIGGNLADKDEEIFSVLAKTKEPFSRAFLSFETQVKEQQDNYQSMMAIPITKDQELLGGIIAYNKKPSDPLDEAVFTDFDRKAIGHLVSLIIPILEATVKGEGAARESVDDSYKKILQQNRERLLMVCEREIQRSDRYHHTFSLVLFHIELLTGIFKDNHQRAFELVEELSRGIRTRTRKTDYLSWIAKDRFALLTLEGGKRIKFMVSRVLVYLDKDLRSLEPREIGRKLLVGQAEYPGTSRTPQDLITEAEKNLTPKQI